MSMAAIHGIELHYDDVGDGPPVVLLPGGGMARGTWNLSLGPVLVAEGFQVIAVDLRGMAPSSCPVEPYGIVDMATDIAGLIELLSVDRCHVVGYSMGAWVAQELALLMPDSVGSLTLLGTIAERAAWEDRWTKAWIEVLQSGVDLPALFDAVTLVSQLYASSDVVGDDEAVAMLVDLFAAQPRDPGHLGQWRAADAYRGRLGALAAIETPTLVVGFEHDLYTPARLGRQVASMIPGAQYVELSGVGHAAPLSHSDRVSPLVLEHLAATAW